MESWHGDIWDFLKLRSEGGDEFRRAHNLDTVNWIPDLLMERAEARQEWSLFSPNEVLELPELTGKAFKAKYEEYEQLGKEGKLHFHQTTSAYNLVKEMLSQLYETGSNWMTFKDPSVFRYMGSKTHKVKSSNLCVAGDTTVLTGQGSVPIKSLEGRTVSAWNGTQWSDTEFFKTSDSAMLTAVTTSLGAYLEVTPEHLWSVRQTNGSHEERQTQDLELGYALEAYECSPVEHGVLELRSAYETGAMNGVLSEISQPSALEQAFFGDKNTEIALRLEEPVASRLLTEEEVLLYSDERYHVPSSVYTLQSRLKWLYGYLTNGGRTRAIIIDPESEEYQFIRAVHNLMLEVGVSPLAIDENETIIGLREGVVETETYCGTEPKQHKLIFNGVLTHQCTEILEPADEEETAVCTLGSIVLNNHLKYDADGIPTGLDRTSIKKAVNTLVRALDSTIEYNYYASDKAATSNSKYRHIGMGVCGFQDVMSSLYIDYASEEAVDFNHEITEFISYHAIMTSIELAKELGPFPAYADSHWADGKMPIDLYCEFNEERPMLEFERFSQAKMDWDIPRKLMAKHGIRNGTLMAIAPTATSSNISMSSPSIEPTFQNIVEKGNMSGVFTDVNRVLRAQLEREGLWDDAMIEEILDNEGIITYIKRIPEYIRRVHKTAFEVGPEWLIKSAAGRGVWIDQSQSLNLYITNATGKKLYDTYRMAWEYGVKTTYYLRSASAQEVDVNEEIAEMDADIKVEITPEASFCTINADGCAVCQ